MANLTEWDRRTDHSGFTILLDAISEIVGPSPLKVKEEEEKRAETTRKTEEEPQKREAEAKQKAEEDQKRRMVKEAIKTDKPELEATLPSEPRKKKNALKFGIIAGVVVLLIAVIWLFYKNQQDKQKSETRIKLEQFYEQVEELERSVAKADNQEKLKGLYRQRDKLSDQVAAFSKQATNFELESQLGQLQDRLKQVQIQLGNKEKELIAPRRAKIFVASAPDNATVKILNIDEPFQQGMELEPGKYHVEASSEGYEPQDRWIELGPGEEKRINFKLAKIISKVARLFVETVPEEATVRILNIKPRFSQGMELEPGSYHVEVAAEGYKTEQRWIDLASGHKKPFRFELNVRPKKIMLDIALESISVFEDGTIGPTEWEFFLFANGHELIKVGSMEYDDKKMKLVQIGTQRSYEIDESNPLIVKVEAHRNGRIAIGSIDLPAQTKDEWQTLTQKIPVIVPGKAKEGKFEVEITVKPK
jgi:hypothetical protein